MNVVREAPSGLVRETWRAYINESMRQVVVNEYTREERPTRRHRFVVARYWLPKHIRGRYDGTLLEALPRMPDAELLAAVLGQFSVVWQDRG